LNCSPNFLVGEKFIAVSRILHEHFLGYGSAGHQDTILRWNLRTVSIKTRLKNQLGMGRHLIMKVTK
jgi:hypothetical protein